MAKASPIITSFNGGEFSPLMAGRVDIKYYTTGCRRIRNFIPARQGPARRRPGTRHVAEVKTSADRTWLSRFEFNVLQAYVLEFGNLYIRFFATHGVVGAPLEVVTPYPVADLTGTDGTFSLRSVQSGDVLYTCHTKYAPQKLTRTGAAAFNIATMVPQGGPFKDIDPAEARTVYIDNGAVGAGRTLTASSAIFLAGHVGSLFYLEQKDVDVVPMWEPGKVLGAPPIARRSNGVNYKSLNAATTGTIKPTHTRGSRYDGDTGVQWQYQNAGYGWCQITAIGGGGTTATVTVLSMIPDGAVGVANASTRWAHGAWSDVEGWPDNVTFFRERLCFSRGRNVWQSVAGSFEDFRDRDEGGLVADDMAITSDITSDRANNIQWLAPADTALLTGTAGDESILAQITTASPLGPGNINARKQAEYGSRHVSPVRVADNVLFVQNAGRKIRSMGYFWEKDGYRAPDVTVLAEHVTKSGVIDMAYQQEPDSVVWIVRADGQLVGLTMDMEQDIKGFHPHRIGGYVDVDHFQFAVVESVTTIPAPNNDRNELWMIVRRYINGATKRYVEWMEYHHEEGDDPDDAFYLDSGLTLDNVKNAILTPGAGATVNGTPGVNFGAPAMFVAGDVGRKIHYRYSTVDVKGKVTWKRAVADITAYVDANNVTCTIRSPWQTLTPIAANKWRMTVTLITGLIHLKGETVQVWANGAAHPDRVVDGAGGITLQDPASKVHVGLGCPAVLQPMPLEAGAADGSALGKKQRVSRCAIRFHDSIGVLYGRDEDKQLDRLLTRGGSDLMDEAPPLFTGVKTVAWPAGYSEEFLLTFVCDQPGPSTIVAIAPQITTQDDR